MISEQASRGFEGIFKNAILSNLFSSEDNCIIDDIKDLTESDASEVVVLTISSPVFRLLVIFHIDFEDSALNYFVNTTQFGDGKIELDTRRDAFLEFCNMCIGTMNRELQNYFIFLGMSTPYVLLQACTTFISALNPVVLKHYRLRINETLVIYATLCISDFGNVDFVENENSTAVDTGQLELF